MKDRRDSVWKDSRDTDETFWDLTVHDSYTHKWMSSPTKLTETAYGTVYYTYTDVVRDYDSPYSYYRPVPYADFISWKIDEDIEVFTSTSWRHRWMDDYDLADFMMGTNITSWKEFALPLFDGSIRDFFIAEENK